MERLGRVTVGAGLIRHLDFLGNVTILVHFSEQSTGSPTDISTKHPFRILSLACLATFATPQGSAQVVFPRRGLFDTSTGYLESLIGNFWYRGCGVIARDPKLIYSCCHLFYEEGLWATDYEFYPAYDGRNAPEAGTGVSPRGFRYFRNYSDMAQRFKGNSDFAFAYDFTVMYGLEPFGEAVSWWQNGAEALRSDRLKRIIGYPQRIEYTGEPGRTFQHGTDWFRNKAPQTVGDYHYFKGVSTGSGNSGGPVYVQDDANNEKILAGILVSGSATTAGVYALNDSSNSMASAALGLPVVTHTYTNRESARLPDRPHAAILRQATASGFAENVTGLKFSLSISTPRRGDLAVWLRSPGGRIRWINKPSSSSEKNLMIKNANLSESFRGTYPNGVWQLKMHDDHPGNRATFNKFTLAITAIGESPP